ncbi:MAG: hypothetical protein ABI969_01715 [bacterium]
MHIPQIILGTTREHYLMLFGAAGVIGLTAGVIGSWLGGFLGARRAARTAPLNASTQHSAALQLEPVMQALDAIALEVERISEAQRFTTKVLAERPGAMLPARTAKSITPH